MTHYKSMLHILYNKRQDMPINRTLLAVTEQVSLPAMDLNITREHRRFQTMQTRVRRTLLQSK